MDGNITMISKAKQTEQTEKAKRTIALLYGLHSEIGRELTSQLIDSMGFAALSDEAIRVLRRAESMGLGKEIPTEWFLEDVSP